jgi:hypothetical protein
MISVVTEAVVEQGSLPIYSVNDEAEEYSRID